MGLGYAALLGVIQGLTEFLPISSSGHLVIVQSLIPNFSQPGVLFDVILHLGTLSAIVIVYFDDIIHIKWRYLYLILLGTIPVVIVGFLLQDYIEVFFTSTKVVAVGLFITGTLNLLIDKYKTAKKEPTEKDSIIIGIAQSIALIPGISRSGSTIFAGVKRGVKREDAARFSFLLSIPAVLGASILQLFINGESVTSNPLYYLVGFLAALITGVFAIYIVIRLLRKKYFKIFAYYCFIVGIIALII